MNFNEIHRFSLFTCTFANFKPMESSITALRFQDYAYSSSFTRATRILA